MRATTPHHNIGGKSTGRNPIPQPKVAVGTKLDLSKVTSYHKPYHLREVTRFVIRNTRESVTRLQARGLLPEMRGKKMLDAHKQSIRDVFEFMRTADAVVVAGVAPSASCQSHNSIANQCYVDGSYSPLRFHYYLMFRKNIEGKELVYTYPNPLLGEWDVLNCVIPESTGAAG